MDAVTGTVIGDLLREWERHNGRISQARYSAAWRAANRARRHGKAAVMAAIHSTLTIR
jgi:hypothetical protein